MLDELRGKGIEIRCEEIKNIEFKELEKLIQYETNDCEKVYLVSTSGANIIAVYLSLIYSQSKNASLVNYIFSFGPWTRYYYPFVPRSLEKVMILGDDKPTNAKLDLNLDSYLRNTTFTRIIESVAKKLNEKLTMEKKERSRF